MHGRRQVPEATVGRGDDDKGAAQLDPPMIDLEGSVGRERVADHRVLPQVGHGVAMVPDVIGGELCCPGNGIQQINP